MPEAKRFLVAGLGNPGADYEETRHNIGFKVIDALSARYRIRIDRLISGAAFGEGVIETVRVVLAKPLLFMNRSGPPIRALSDHFRIISEDVLVIHDDIDLAFGRLKIKEKGGDGGHKGVKSIIDAFGRNDFPRLRIGIGRSEDQTGVTEHVLGRFDSGELPMVNRTLGRSTEAVAAILCHGTKEGMNRFNSRKTAFYS